MLGVDMRHQERYLTFESVVCKICFLGEEKIFEIAKVIFDIFKGL